VITIRQVMNSHVTSLSAEAAVEQAVEILTQTHISSLPVVGSAGQLVGMISEMALFDVVFDESIKSQSISNYMTADAQTVHPDEPLTRAAQLFALYTFRLLPVVENGKLIGTITRRDLMTFSLRTNQVLADPLITLIPALAPMS
jgi:CBS domain-containing protein